MKYNLIHLAFTVVLLTTVGCIPGGPADNTSTKVSKKLTPVVDDTKTDNTQTPSIVTISVPSNVELIAPTVASSDVVSVTVKVSGVSAGQTVALYKDAACTTTPLVSGTATATSINLGISDLVNDDNYKFYAKATKGADASNCSTAYASYTLARTPVFTSLAASVTPTAAPAGATVSIAAAIGSNMSLKNLNIDLELRDSATSAIIEKKAITNVDFVANVKQTFTWSYVVPATASISQLYLTVGVFNSSWNKTYMWNNNAGLLTKLTAAKSSTALGMLGVNLSGGEFNPTKAGARQFYDYVYPNNAEIDYLASKNMKVIRVPFTMVRLQPTRNGALATSELDALDKVIAYAKTKNIIVILDPHDYGKMMDDQGVMRILGKDTLMPASYFADFWSKLATYYKSSTNVYFNLINEPYAQTAVEWRDVAVAAINAIRATGATQKIMIPGTSYTGAHSWISSGNAAAWTGFTDSNFVYEVHQYLDSDNSGMHTDCTVGVGNTRLAAFTNWARTNGVKGFLGEFGWAINHKCSIEGFDLLNYMAKNTDVWTGGTYFASGPWMGTYMYTAEPVKVDATYFDRAQFTILNLFN